LLTVTRLLVPLPPPTTTGLDWMHDASSSRNVTHGDGGRFCHSCPKILLLRIQEVGAREATASLLQELKTGMQKSPGSGHAHSESSTLLEKETEKCRNPATPAPAIHPLLTFHDYKNDNLYGGTVGYWYLVYPSYLQVKSSICDVRWSRRTIAVFDFSQLSASLSSSSVSSYKLKLFIQLCGSNWFQLQQGRRFNLTSNS